MFARIMTMIITIVCTVGTNDQLAKPALELVDVQRPLDLHGNGPDRLVLAMAAFHGEEVGIHLQGPVQVETADIEKLLSRIVHLALDRPEDGGGGIDGLDLLFDLDKDGWVRHKVRLVEKDLVGKGNLLCGLVHRAIRFGLGQTLEDMLGINDGHYAIETELLLNVFVLKKGLDYGCRIGKAGRLQKNTVDAMQVDLGVEVVQRANQIATDAATDAAICHLDDLLIEILLDDLIVNRDGTNFIFNHCKFLTMHLVRENVIQELWKEQGVRSQMHLIRMQQMMIHCVTKT